MYTSHNSMTAFTRATEVLASLLYGNEKRRVHFRIVDCETPAGIDRRFGLSEYLYCEKHCTWHEQKNEAYVPISEWSKLVDYSQMVDVYSKAIVEQLASEKANTDGEKTELTAEPERKHDEVLAPKDPPLQQYCDDGHGNAIAVGYGCAPTGTPEQR
jgi:hypothetical protein